MTLRRMLVGMRRGTKVQLIEGINNAQEINPIFLIFQELITILFSPILEI
jgi:hypothetical protein